MVFRKMILVMLATLCPSLHAMAAQITFSGYDINDAVMSGHGNWSHSYSGTITPGSSFVNFTFPGRTATYSGVGSGTLNDGIIGSSISNTQLFVTPQSSSGLLINPAIFITLPNAYTVDTIDVYEGNFSGNAIPGALTGVTVQLFGPNGLSAALPLSLTKPGPPGLNGQLVFGTLDLTSTVLANVPAFTIILSNFQGNLANWFSIGEIEAFGNLAPPPNGVPEPASIAVWSLVAGIFGLGGLRRQLKRRAAA